MIIRPANEGEAAALSALALESKQHWGFSPRDIVRWRAELAISPADPNAEAFYVARGAVRQGTVAAPTADDPGHCRPQLLLEIAIAAQGRKSSDGHPPWL